MCLVVFNLYKIYSLDNDRARYHWFRHIGSARVSNCAPYFIWARSMGWCPYNNPRFFSFPIHPFLWCEEARSILCISNIDNGYYVHYQHVRSLTRHVKSCKWCYCSINPTRFYGSSSWSHRSCNNASQLILTFFISLNKKD